MTFGPEFRTTFGKWIPSDGSKRIWRRKTREKAGVTYEDWFGNDQADEQAKKGAAKHNYTEEQMRAARDNVNLAKRVQDNMMNTCLNYINRRQSREDQ